MASDIAHAAGMLKRAMEPLSPRDGNFREVAEIRAAKDAVLARFQPVFSQDHLPALSEDEFRGFLRFRNNRHWRSLHRLGSVLSRDMDRLRAALVILLDENRPIRDRMNELVPHRGKPFVRGLRRAVLTPILLVTYPDRYGVWNRVSTEGMKSLNIYPQFERGLPFGDRYERINSLLHNLAAELEVDLWTLDALWWRVDAVLDHAELRPAVSPPVPG